MIMTETPAVWNARMLKNHTKGWHMLVYICAGILRYNKGSIVEIGMGASTIELAHLARIAEVTLYSCDLMMGGMFKAFNDKLFPDHICFIGKSEDFIKQFEGEPSIAFIDGQHDYEVVKMEGDFLLEKLKTGGVLFMHDTFPPSERLTAPNPKPHDVYKYRQELERNPDYDVFTWPYSSVNMGLTMVMKHRKDRPYWLKNGRQ